MVVDPQRRTADPHILAIGDVTGQPMLAHKAATRAKWPPSPGRPNGRLPAAGHPRGRLHRPGNRLGRPDRDRGPAAGRPVEVAQFPWAASGRAQSIGRTEGLTKWLIDPESGRLLGCGIVGAGAGDLISEAVLAIEMGATVRDLVDTIHPHPTLSETLGGAAEVYFGTATDLYRPRRK